MQQHYVLCGVFVVLLTIILYGLAKSVIKMSFGEPNYNKLEVYAENLQKLSFGMYAPQAVMLTLAFSWGVFTPIYLDSVIRAAIVGFGG